MNQPGRAVITCRPIWPVGKDMASGRVERPPASLVWHHRWVVNYEHALSLFYNDSLSLYPFHAALDFLLLLLLLQLDIR